MSIGSTAIELRVFKKKKKKKNMDKMGKTFLGIIFMFGAFLLRFLVYCLVFTYKVLCVTLRGWIKSAATHFIAERISARQLIRVHISANTYVRT